MSDSPRPGDDEGLLDQVGPALSRLRRRTSGGRGDLTRNLVLNVVHDDPGEMTVGGVAAEMGVAQPVASRTVAACIADGLLRRAVSQADGRRTVLELTEAGEAERGRFASEQREAFEFITAGWTAAERDQFARFLIRYSQDSSDWSRRQALKGRPGGSAATGA
ncbi:MarR family winged helix-turn-helix transcriptional regulator [Lentzea sp. BCCO 10_0061]|uniref:MarR family winged helix-turn-helix transcriptional regulator n=1 Tax=Lentzea sokolovensis TaxID=3095429 RepID=A0ABU4UQE5_9PSEU|nr:MarR family winged helix-turn-helix transcriptional regulator [Lentzea sp. BCCO 10_0061]MDX8141716.1 MarR family winged helix-turn-helix transcriptional regulator [Lentzea sp. BCCO 10_0061]